MSEIIKTRVIRPSSHSVNSSYRIHIGEVGANDILVVKVKHENGSFKKTFRFNGKEVVQKKSLSFRVKEDGSRIKIKWYSTQPING